MSPSHTEFFDEEVVLYYKQRLVMEQIEKNINVEQPKQMKQNFQIFKQQLQHATKELQSAWSIALDQDQEKLPAPATSCLFPSVARLWGRSGDSVMTCLFRLYISFSTSIILG